MSEPMYYKREYPKHSPNKAGWYYTDLGKAVFHRHPQTNAEWWSETLEGQGYDLDVKWFLEPVPEVKGADEYLTSKAWNDLDYNFDNVVSLLTEFAQLQKPVSEENTFEELFLKHQEFTRNTFPFATAKGSLIKLIEEANETIDELRLTDYDGNALPLEYVDCMMCLLDSLQRSNIDFKQFKRYFKMKLSINLSRTWKQNKDGSYSHIK